MSNSTFSDLSPQVISQETNLDSEEEATEALEVGEVTAHVEALSTVKLLLTSIIMVITKKEDLAVLEKLSLLVWHLELAVRPSITLSKEEMKVK